MANPLSIFQKPNKPVYLKMGLYGNTGSGKTFTAAQFAIGAVKSLDSKKPVVMFDTETGSDYLTPMFEAAGIELLIVKSRAFSKLVEATQEAEKIASFFIIDSIGHVWDELIAAYKKKKGRKYIQINEWGEIKEYWSAFTKAYLNANLDIILCSRAQDITENSTDEQGQKDFAKIGERMKGEKYMGYEPSLLVRMEAIQDLGKNKVTHMAYVEKDRTNNMTGAAIAEPTFASFAPVWAAYDKKAAHVGIDNEDSTQHISDPDWSIEDRKRRRAIAIEEIQNILVRSFPSTGQKDKQAKMALLREVYGTDNWVKLTEDIKAVRLEDLEDGLPKLEAAAKVAAGVPEVKPTIEAAVVTARSKKGAK